LEPIRSSYEPFFKRNADAFDDRPHRAEQKNAATVAGHNHLLRGGWISPLLMTTGFQPAEIRGAEEF
jgi:hypothetical protein